MNGRHRIESRKDTVGYWEKQRIVCYDGKDGWGHTAGGESQKNRVREQHENPYHA